MILAFRNASFWTKVLYVPIGRCRHLGFTVSALVMEKALKSCPDLGMGVNRSVSRVRAFFRNCLRRRISSEGVPRIVRFDDLAGLILSIALDIDHPSGSN